MSANEWTLAAVIATISFLVGFAHVKRAPRPTRRVGLDPATHAPRSGPNLADVLFGGPLRAVLVFVCLLFLAGLNAGVRGSGIVGALKAGVAVAVLYGFGIAFLAVPVAIVGGLVALFVRNKR